MERAGTSDVTGIYLAMALAFVKRASCCFVRSWSYNLPIVASRTRSIVVIHCGYPNRELVITYTILDLWINLVEPIFNNPLSGRESLAMAQPIIEVISQGR